MSTQFGHEGRAVLHAAVFPSKQELVDKGRIGDTSDSSAGHDNIGFEIVEAEPEGVVLKRSVNGVEDAD